MTSGSFAAISDVLDPDKLGGVVVFILDVVDGSTGAVSVAFVVLEGFLVVCLVVLVNVQNADYVLSFNCLDNNVSSLTFRFLL